MRGFKMTQKNGKETTVGSITGKDFVSYTDDFSAFSGRVYLCGVTMQTSSANRVDGLAPHWCYQKMTIQTSLQQQRSA